MEIVPSPRLDYCAACGKEHGYYCPLETTEDLLNERDKTHGSFVINSRVSQQIKDAIRNEPTYSQLHAIHREALDFIAGKIGRIMAGQYDFDDHWDDIAGYAKLPAKFNHGKER